MVSAIYFYDQTLLKTHKVWDITINRMLPTELKSQLTATQALPQS